MIALACPTLFLSCCLKKGWKGAMREEICALVKNKIREIVQKLKGTKKKHC